MPDAKAAIARQALSNAAQFSLHGPRSNIFIDPNCQHIRYAANFESQLPASLRSRLPLDCRKPLRSGCLQYLLGQETP